MIATTKKFSQDLISAQAKYKLNNEEMGTELGMTERQYIRYQNGEYDGKDIKAKIKESLVQLMANGPQYVRKGEGGNRIEALEKQMQQVMADLYKIKSQLGI